MVELDMALNKIPIPEISLNTQGLFFRKVAYTRHDARSEMFQADNVCLVQQI
jgi:hypothetical protein